MQNPQENMVKRSVTYSLIAIAAIGVIVAFLSIYAAGVSNQAAPGNNDVGTSANQYRVSFKTLTDDGSPVQGNPSAPVTLVEFGDFQCEFCARFAKETEPQISQNYIETGKVNMVFKHLVHYGSDSTLAAAASQCANDQGKFWDFYHALYTNQDSFMLSQNSESVLKNLVSRIDGIDTQKFDSCLAGGAYENVAKKDAPLASSLKFDNTPSFLIIKSDGSDPQSLVGAYPFATFKTILDKEIGAQ
jgi:protein-disulfide isomerase